MTTVSDAKKELLSAFTTAWASRTPVTFDNESFNPPSDGAWLRTVIRNTDSAQETLGRVTNRKFERIGVVLTQVFTPSNGGTSEADALSMAVRDIFEGTRIGGVVLNNVVIREIGVDGKWYQVNVEASFFYTEIK